MEMNRFWKLSDCYSFVQFLGFLVHVDSYFGNCSLKVEFGYDEVRSETSREIDPRSQLFNGRTWRYQTSLNTSVVSPGRENLRRHRRKPGRVSDAADSSVATRVEPLKLETKLAC